MNRITLGMLLLSMVALSSCVTSKKMVYVKDLQPDTLYRVADLPPLLVQKNDRISIEVSAKNPELAVPFNTAGGSYSVNEDGSLNTGTDRPTNAKGYLVDREGNIAFPVLGTLQLEGLSIEEVKDLVSNRLKEEKYIDKPIVKVELLNLKINIMGEVIKVGLLEVPDSRITLLEAISRAGGLTLNAVPRNVTVIREENGQRKRIETDIESVKLFDSPAYYLKQNDIVYVQPKVAARSVAEQRTWQYISTILGSIALIFSVITLGK